MYGYLIYNREKTSIKQNYNPKPKNLFFKQSQQHEFERKREGERERVKIIAVNTFRNLKHKIKEIMQFLYLFSVSQLSIPLQLAFVL